MYVYRKTEPQLWTVGFYAPDGSWEPESDHGSETEAAERVHWLNGGDKHNPALDAVIWHQYSKVPVSMRR